VRRFVAGRVRTLVSAVVVVALGGGLFVAAVDAGGYHAAAVQLNDAGVWVTNQSDGSIGRLNTAIDVVDTRMAVSGTDFDVVQSGSTVLVDDRDQNKLLSVDVALATYSAQTGLPPGAGVFLGGTTAAVLDGVKGHLWIGPASTLAGQNFSQVPPTADVNGSAAVAVGVDGTVHVVDGSGQVTGFDASGRRTRGGSVPTGVQSPQITAVGPTAVVLDPGGGRLYVPGRASIDVSGLGGNPVLQQPGPDRSFVVVATDRGLFDVPLAGGGPLTLFGGGTGSAIAPVWLDGCGYGAWQRAPVYATVCAGKSPVSATITNLPTPAKLHFQVNRDRVVLNEVISGSLILFVDNQAQRIDDWSQALTNSPDNGQPDNPNANPQQVAAAVKKLQRSTVNHPPVALDDHAATRAGRPVLIYPLTNDSDPDDDVLIITPLEPLPAGEGTATVVADGEAIQFTPGPGQLGTVKFPYTISDGRGGTASAQIIVDIKAADSRLAPLTVVSHAVVEAGKQVTVDVLAPDSDPQGDALTLVSVSAPTGAVQFRPDGQLTYTASANGSGPVTVLYSVANEAGVTAQGRLVVDVEPIGTEFAPVARNHYVRTTVGQAGVVDVLAGDTDPTDAPLSVVRVDSLPDATVTWQPSGEVRLVAPKAGSYEVVYEVSDGTATASAVLRVDVDQGTPGPPVAVRDDVLVHLGTPVVVDVVANDEDPTGGVLVVESVDVDPNSGLAVEILDHHLLRITETTQLAGSVAFTYVVSNGDGQSTGTVVARPAPVGFISQAPVTTPIDVSIRAGNVTSIDALAHDSSPDGDSLTLVSVSSIPSVDGVLFVEANQLRYQAPATPIGALAATYVVADTVGNQATGELSIHVLPVASANHPPDPPTLTARTFVGRPVTVQVPLLGMDPDGDPVSLLGLVDPPGFGQVSVEGGDAFVYQSDGSSVGTDRFTYKVQDSLGAQALGTVLVGVAPPPSIASPPVAEPVTAKVKPGGTVRIDALASDTDPNDSPISFQSGTGAVGTPRIGSAQIEGGVIVYTTPADAPETQVSFDYGITDALGATATGLVTVTITDTIPPQPPIARDVTVAAQRAGAHVSVDVVSNDADPDGQSGDLTLSVSGAPEVSVIDDKLQLTMPDANVDFVYTVTNPEGLSARAVVQVPLAVSLAPVANHDEATTEVNKPVKVDVLANDVDPAGKALSLAGVASQQDGSATVEGRDVVFTPAPGFVGIAGFAYEITDGTNNAVGTVTVTVTGTPAHPNPPVVTQLTLSLAAGAETSVDLSKAVSDPDPEAVETFSGLGGAPAKISAALHGSILTVKAGVDAGGVSARLSYEVNDGHPGGTATGVVTVTVVSSTTPKPVAVPDTAETNQGVAVTIDVVANDIDPLGKGLTVSVGTVANGQAQVVANNVVFTPDPSFVGQTTFTYTIADGSHDPTRDATGTVTVTVVGRPSAPTAPTGTIASHAVALSWDVPSANGAPIDHYTLVSDGGLTMQCPTNACTFTGLTDGKTYAFRVSAHNRAGDGPFSPASTSFTPDALPSPPAAPTSHFGDGQITLTWAAPTDTGSPIISYTIEINPPTAQGPSRQVPPSTTYTWAGLTNGTAYTFALAATNGAGTSAVGPESAPVTPAGVPIDLVAPTAVGANSQITVSWSAPNDNGSPIEAYELDPSAAGQAQAPIPIPNPSTLSDVLSNLTNGSSYTFTFRAENAAGWSALSPPSAPVSLGGVPDQITSVTATAGDQLATLAFTPPADNGDPITGYQAMVNGGSPQPLAANDQVTGLTNGTSYTFEVEACNAAGCGPPSPPSNAVTPKALQRPTAVITDMTVADPPPCTSANFFSHPYACTMNVSYSVGPSDIPIKYIQWWTNTAQDPLGTPGLGITCLTAPCTLDSPTLYPGYRGLSPMGSFTDTFNEGWLDISGGESTCVWITLVFTDGVSTSGQMSCITWPSTTTTTQPQPTQPTQPQPTQPTQPQPTQPTQPPPPPTVTISVGQHGGAESPGGQSAGNSYWVVVSVSNCSANAGLTIACYDNEPGPQPFFSGGIGSADSNGNGTYTDTCFDNAGAQVYVTVNGVRSNTITM